MKTLLFLAVIFLFNSLYAFDSETKAPLVFTVEETQWLKEHPEIRVASDQDFPPVEWLSDNNQFQGIAIDYLRILEKKLPVKFIPVSKNSWSDILQGMKDQKIDLISAIARNHTREQYLLFTRPYLSFPAVIISSHQYKHLNDLQGKRVGVVTDSYWDDLLKQSDFNIEIVRLENDESGVEMVSLGAIDAMISNLATVSYAVKKMGISNLNIVHVPKHEHRMLELSFGIRKDWPLLQSVLQKAIDSISEEEKDHIYNKWIKLQPITFWQSTQFWYPVIIITLIIFIGVFSILLWNRTLKQKIAERTRALEKAQKQLIYAEKMESVGRLSAGVAHEVKNPLAILQMSIDYLKGEKNDETVSTILNDMQDAVERADSVIKGLLDFSREKELQMQQDNINTVIKNSIHLIEHDIKQNNISLNLKLDKQLPDIPMDKNRLQQVFINLFMNAIQAMLTAAKQQGNINNRVLKLAVYSSVKSVTDSWIIENSEGQFKTGQKVIEIKILDTGTGLDKQHETAVFEPFFTTKAQGEGTGLGLSVSRSIIGLHHGMIAMRNRMDNTEGVEVIILFPFKNNKDKLND